MKKLNDRVLTTLFEDVLSHMTREEKQAYNKEYYQNNKQYWVDYYKYGITKPRATNGIENAARTALTNSGYSSGEALSLLKKNGVNLEEAYKLLKSGKSLDQILNSQLDSSLNRLESMTDEQIDKVIKTSTDRAVDYINRNQDKIAKMAVDSLEEIGRASVEVGKKMIKEIGKRAKESAKSSWELGVDQIVSSTKNLFSKIKGLS